MPDNVLVNTISNLKVRLKQLTDRKINVQLFSEGEIRSFKSFQNEESGNVVDGINLNGDPLYIFHAFVSADILLPGYSSLSYMAALFSRNFVLHLSLESIVMGDGNLARPIHEIYPVPPSFAWIQMDNFSELSTDARHLTRLKRILVQPRREKLLKHEEDEEVVRSP